MRTCPDSSPWIRKACLLLTLLFGVFCLGPFINYQAFLSTGDHGLNLYASQAILEGQKPYADFHWFYGPLMLYYYALCLKWFGVGIQSVLLGSVILKLISGLLIFGICVLYLSPMIAFGAAAWFWLFNFDFFYTYNHTGGITLSLLILYLLLLYYKTQKTGYLIAGSIACAALGMIKLNLGFCGIFCLNAGPVLQQMVKREQFPASLKKYLWASSLLVPVFLFAANWWFVRGLPFYVISQCYQYFGNDTDAWAYSTPWQVIINMKEYLISRVRPHNDLMAFTIVCFLAWMALCVRWMIPSVPKEKRRDEGLVIATLSMFLVCFLHEYILSGVIFRAFWAQPFLFLLMFFSAGLALRLIPCKARTVFLLCLFAVLGTRCAMKIQKAGSFKNQNQFLALDRANIYVGNSFDWIYTVTNTTRYLQKHMHPDETLFVLPYDPLYYFLLDRLSPNRQVAMLKFVNIPEEQEQQIVDDLKKNPPRWVIMSNRATMDQQGTGQLGVTYGKRIDQYIKDNYTVDKEYGHWEGTPGWTANHSTRILQRN